MKVIVLCFLFALSALTAVLSQPITVTDACATGTYENYMLIATSTNSFGYYVYELGDKKVEFTGTQWEYTIGGVVLAINPKKGVQRPFAPCSSTFPWTSVNSCGSPVGVSGGGCTSLPIDLLYFTANRDKAGVTIRWKTALEYNNAGFEILHSTDGKIFQTISAVSAVKAGYLYMYNHINDSYGVSYYRLKQIDTDGKTTLFKIVSVEAGTSEVLKVVNNTVTVAGEIIAYDLMGRVVAKSNNFLDLSTLSKGQIIIVKASAQTVKHTIF